MSLEELLDLQALRRLELHDPWLALIAVPGLLAVWWAHRRRRARSAVIFPTTSRLRGLGPTWRQRAAVAIPILHALAVLCFAVAAARPRKGDVRTEVTTDGIAIQMVLDRSSSMTETVEFRDREMRRIDVVKRVFEEFVRGNGADLPGRRGDLIGLTTFARFTEESCPLISEHEPLLTAVKDLRTVPKVIDQYGRQVADEDLPDPQRIDPRRYRQNPLNATAIGDGLRRAVLSLVTAEEDLARTKGDEETYKIRGKVIILLTDGEDNASEMSPVEAGKLAREHGIRVYYILLADPVLRGRDPIFGRTFVMRERSPEEMLAEPRQIVGDTGRAFLAKDGDSLAEVYAEIDRLEKSRIGKVEYRSYDEKYHIFLIPGFA
ncbi:MAG TPA: VWA domain-containing protein, partial [Planctomycetota bacterium]|nr:VWA domain-containing protein [Planctomycetota bacterium]